MQLIQNGTQGPATIPAKQPAVGTPGFAYGGPPGSTPSSRWDADMANTILAEMSGLVVTAGMALDPANNQQLVTAIPKVVSATANNWTAFQTYTVGLVLANDVYLYGKDTSGNSHALIGYDTTNTVHMFSGTGGLVITKSDASAQNVVLDDSSGNINFRGQATAANYHIPNNQAYYGTDTAGAPRLLISYASDNNVYMRIGSGGQFTIQDAGGTTAYLSMDAAGNVTAHTRLRAGSGAVGSGDLQAATLLADYNSSLGTTGWKIYPDKNSPTGYTIRQWGTFLLSGSTSDTVTLPVTFPHGFLSILAVDDGPNCYPYGASPATLGSFNLYSQVTVVHGGNYVAEGY